MHQKSPHPSVLRPAPRAEGFYRPGKTPRSVAYMVTRPKDRHTGHARLFPPTDVHSVRSIVSEGFRRCQRDASFALLLASLHSSDTGSAEASTTRRQDPSHTF